MRVIATQTRDQLIPALTITGKNVLEIGVGDSSFSRIILDSDPEIRLTAIDPFTDPEGEIPNFYDHDTHATKIDLLKRDFGDRYTFINAGSPSGLDHITDETFDWVFVDGDHLTDGVLADLAVAHRLVKPGGAVACHDFSVHNKAVENRQEVVDATREYLAKHTGYVLYGIDLSVYSTSILIKQPSEESVTQMDELLAPWLLHSFRALPADFSVFDFSETIKIDGDTYSVDHTLSLGGEAVRVRTDSKRIFSGYYDNIVRQIL